jgi:NAD-specific glutamate dehydrogenase
MDRANGSLDEQAITDWAEVNKAAVMRTSSLISEFRLSGNVDLAQLAIVNRHMRSLLIS